MPSTATDRLNGLTTSVAVKAPCRVATTANITLSGEQTVDGVAVVTGDRVLVKDQTNSVNNGIYEVNTSAWSRSPDFDGARDAVKGTLVIVEDGSTNATTVWKLTTADTVDIGTDAITFTQALLEDTAAAKFIQAGTGAIERTGQAKMREIVSVTDFGNGTDSAACVSALATGKAVYVPDGDDYQWDTSITLPTKCRMYGAGVDRTIINSEIAGDSLFKAEPTGASFIHVSHMRLNGNGVTGASGSGHCFNFIDPAPISGSATPQIAELENLWIDGFRGTDDADENGVTKTPSCGVMIYGGLGNTCRRVYISDCGQGFYMRRTQNCRILDSLVTDIDYGGVFAYDNENLVVDKCDIIDCQKSGSSQASGHPSTDSDFAGNFIAVGNNNLVLSNSKLKGFQGKALIVLKGDGSIGDGQNIVVENCWLRGDAQADITHKAIYAYRIAGLVIRNNYFVPSNTGYSTKAYETIELYTPSNTPAFESTVEGNTFVDVSGMNITYNIKIGGNGTTRAHRTTVRNNRFGSNSSRSAACTVTADILLESCLLDSCFVGHNSFYAPTNVTRTACVTASSIAKQKTTIGPNLFQTGGGTIAANYSGITESVLTGSAAAVNPSSLADGAGETQTVTVTGAEAGDYALASFENALQGITMTAWVSAADTVSVRFQNESGGVVDLGSGTLRARVTKTWAF